MEREKENGRKITLISFYYNANQCGRAFIDNLPSFNPQDNPVEEALLLFSWYSTGN